MKYKKGDEVTITKDIEYGKYAGCIAHIRECIKSKTDVDDCYLLDIDDGFNCWSEDVLYPSHRSLYITADGYNTYGVLKCDNTIIKKSHARCCPDDIFDFETGAELCVSRIFGRECDNNNEPVEPTESLNDNNDIDKEKYVQSMEININDSKSVVDALINAGYETLCWNDGESNDVVVIEYIHPKDTGHCFGEVNEMGYSIKDMEDE